ncbi:MFS transporter [Nocardiopsis sp. CNR-923]|uniref:MFS transporter n=1 Tax=Nocardiopsis sp. CNR-923 TaxID=1904965 RepID=UPI00095E82F8|nr:MFS transporter [Nocardiopsis sp. CNR-923]OLT28330.1 MFS transporter [Nocardiopsis sp. CNR-923]
MSRRALVGLVSAEALALTGTRISLVAVPWFVLETTDSPAHMGLVTLFEMGAYTLARLFGGPALDRVGQRAVSVRLDLVAAAALLPIPLLHGGGLLPFPLLLALVTVVGLATGPSESAKVSMAPSVAAATGTRLERVTALTGTVDRLSQSVGPVAAGALVGLLGALSALLLTGTLMILASAVLAALAPRTRPGGDADAEGGYPARLHAGWSAVWGDRTLRVLVVMIMVTNLIDTAVMTIALPLWVRGHGLGPEAVGLVAGVLGGGSVLGSLVAVGVGHRLPRGLTLFGALALTGPPRILVLALDTPLWLTVAVWGVAGLGGGLVNPILAAVVFERLPAHLVGRGTAMVGALTRLAAPVGAPVVGAAIALLGISPVLLVCSVVYGAVVTLSAFGPRTPPPGGGRGSWTRPGRPRMR